MWSQDNRERKTAWVAVITVGSLGIAAMLLNTGCGRSEAPPDTAPGTPPVPQAASAARPAPAPVIPAPDIPEDAPVLQEVYPALTSGVLSLARLIELPSGVLLQAEGFSITESDLQSKLDEAPSQMREQLRLQTFFLLEQEATGGLLLARARRQLGGESLDDDRLIQRYLEQIAGAASVSDAEVETFYEENREMVGGTPLERVTAAIRQHLQQEKQQILVENHIRDLGRDASIAVSAAWVQGQAARALENPLDQARASGTPTLASFGADSCMPCQMMKPFREAIAEKYGDRLNVVYVHVNKDQILASRYGVRGIPHTIFFDADGREVHARTGLMDQDQLEEWVRKIGVEL